MPSFLLIQWGIIGFFVIIHFLIGFLRGTQKSTYFTIVSLIMTIVTIWIVSKISLNMFFSAGMSFQSMIDLINGYAGGIIPADVITYITDPEIIGIAIALIDMVIRLIAFIFIYPSLKFTLTIMFFKPVWKHLVLPRLLKKQNEKASLEYQENQTSNKKFVPDKRLNKNIISRLFGGAVGSLRGLVVAFIFLVPLLVLAGFASEINQSVQINQDNQNTQLSTSTQVASIIPSDIQDILDNIDEMNKGGLSAIVKDIKITGKPLDRYIFDTVFTTHIVVEDKKTAINFGNEFEQIAGIAKIIIQNGYLDNYDFNDLSKEDIDNLELVLNHVGKSELISYMIPAAARYGVENFAPDFIEGINLHDRTASKKALDKFYEISWEEEFNNIFKIADAALNFASLGEWKTYVAQPELLAELTPEEGIMLANILRALGDLETLTLLNVAIDYATTLEVVQEQITWMDPSEIEGYLQDKFAFILNDPKFFTGDTEERGEIDRIAQIIETVFSDSFGDSNLTTLINSINDPQALLDNQNPDWVGAVLGDLIEVKLFIEAIPVGVDYAFYTQLRDSMDQDLADQIIVELETIQWDAEVTNVSDIYKEALKLGVGAIFGENPDYYQIIDQVAENHMTSLKSIVTYIFEGSEVVNVAIELASPAIVDKFVTDEALKEVILDILISDSPNDEVNFEFGVELNNILSIVESVFLFSTSSELAAIPGLEQNELLETIAKFSNLTNNEYDGLRTAINSLQILSRAGESGLSYVKAKMDIPNLYVPTTVALNNDIAVMLDIAYDLANFIKDESGKITFTFYQDIDFTDLLSDTDFRNYFISTNENKHSDLIFYNIAHNLKHYSENGNISDFISIPTNLTTENIESEIWETEINALLGSIFDLATALGETPNIELSLKGITEASKTPMELSIKTLTQFSDLNLAEDTFGNLDSSRILRNSLIKTIESLGSKVGDSLYGYQLTVPDHLIVDGMLKTGTLTNLIYSIAVVVEEIDNAQSFITLNDGLNYTKNTGYLNTFLSVSDEGIETLISADLIHGILSDALDDAGMQQSIVDLLNESQDIIVFASTILEVDPLLKDVQGLVKAEEIANILFALRNLGLTDTASFNSVGIATFTNTLGSNVDPITEEDDFDRVFNANYIYMIVAKLIGDPAFGDYIGDMLTGAFGDDPIPLVMDVPADALGNTGVEDGLMTKAELRHLVIAFDLLGLDASTDITVTTIMDLMDKNIDPITNEDDFSRFIGSIYIQDKISQLLLSEYVVELIANNRFLYDDFKMPASSLNNDRMLKQEIYDLFYGLKIISLTDFDNVDINLTDITSLTDTEKDQLLDSTYLYVTLDLMLKSEAALVVPTDAEEDVGHVFEGMIKKEEIKDLLEAFSILGDSDPSTINVNDVTIQDLEDMLTLESNIIDQMISDALEDNLTTIPLTAYNLLGTRITRDELGKMIDTLSVLSNSDNTKTIATLMPIDTNTITTLMLQDIHNLDSRIVDRITSEAIIDSGISIHSLAYDPSSEFDEVILTKKLDIKRSELGDMIDALEILNIDISSANTVDQTSYTPTNIEALLDLESLIVYRMISKSIIDQNLETDESIAEITIDTNYDPEAIGSDLKISEMEALVEAMKVLGITNLTEPIDVSSVGIEELEKTHYLGLGIDPDGDLYESRIIHRLISDAVDDSITVPSEAYMTLDLLDIEKDEISALIDSLKVMGLTTLADPITVDTLTIEQLKGINYLGYGTNPNPTEEKYDSIIIHRLISESIVDSLYSGNPLNAPDYVFITLANEDLKTDEVNALIDALEAMGLTTLGDPINVDGLTLEQLQNVHYLGLGVPELPAVDTYQSLIIHRLVSDAVVDSLYNGNPLNAPTNAFITAANEDLEADEISALIKSLEVMDLTKLSDPIDVNALNVTKLKSIHELGLGTPELPTVDTYQSLIIHRLVSDAIVDSLYSGNPLNAPTGAFITAANEDLEADEVSALIAAMEEMHMTSLGASLSITNPSRDQLQNLHYLGLEINPVDELYQSLIVHRLISETVIGALSVPDDAYMTVAQKDIEVDEISALIAAMHVMNITSLTAGFSFSSPTTTQIQQLNYLGLGSPVNPVNDVYDSYIVHRLLSDSIKTAITVPSEAFIPGRPNDVKAEEIDHLIVTMGILGVTEVADIATEITIPNLKALTNQEIEILVEASTNGPNVIVYYMISDVIDPDNDLLVDDAKYVMPGVIRIRLKRESIADALIAIP